MSIEIWDSHMFYVHVSLKNGSDYALSESGTEAKSERVRWDAVELWTAQNDCRA
jgi:hypothetical protein